MNPFLSRDTLFPKRDKEKTNEKIFIANGGESNGTHF
nr:MAG TPA: hypothetical protein [Caudoviricetes sp.]